MAIARQPNRRFPDAGRSHSRAAAGDTRELYKVSKDPVDLVRHEEEATIHPVPRDAGAVRLRKRVDRLLARADVAKRVEDADVERRPVEAGDSGEVETLPDGSISIPIFEEEVVVTKRMVVRERLIVRKATRTERIEVPLELKRERIEMDVDPKLKDRIRQAPPRR